MQKTLNWIVQLKRLQLFKMIIWIIGISGTGKTTIGKKLFDKIRRKKSNTVFLDGDILRKVWGDDLGHKIADREKNALRILRLCQLLNNQKINVVCCLLSIFPAIQKKARNTLKKYYQVHLTAPIKQLMKRDTKKIYKKYFDKKIKNVVGLDIRFPKPYKSDLVIESFGSNTPNIITNKIFNKLNLK